MASHGFSELQTTHQHRRLRRVAPGSDSLRNTLKSLATVSEPFHNGTTLTKQSLESSPTRNCLNHRQSRVIDNVLINSFVDSGFLAAHPIQRRSLPLPYSQSRREMVWKRHTFFGRCRKALKNRFNRFQRHTEISQPFDPTHTNIRGITRVLSRHPDMRIPANSPLSQDGENAEIRDLGSSSAHPTPISGPLFSSQYLIPKLILTSPEMMSVEICSPETGSSPLRRVRRWRTNLAPGDTRKRDDERRYRIVVSLRRKLNNLQYINRGLKDEAAYQTERAKNEVQRNIVADAEIFHLRKQIRRTESEVVFQRTRADTLEAQVHLLKTQTTKRPSLETQQLAKQSEDRQLILEHNLSLTRQEIVTERVEAGRQRLLNENLLKEQQILQQQLLTLTRMVEKFRHKEPHRMSNAAISPPAIPNQPLKIYRPTLHDNTTRYELSSTDSCGNLRSLNSTTPKEVVPTQIHSNSDEDVAAPSHARQVSQEFENSFNLSALFELDDTNSEPKFSRHDSPRSPSALSPISQGRSAGALSHTLFRFGSRRVQAVPAVRRIRISTTGDGGDHLLASLGTWEWTSIPDLQLFDPRV